jgi:hypothetical protein
MPMTESNVERLGQRRRCEIMLELVDLLLECEQRREGRYFEVVPSGGAAGGSGRFGPDSLSIREQRRRFRALEGDHTAYAS